MASHTTVYNQRADNDDDEDDGGDGDGDEDEDEDEQVEMSPIKVNSTHTCSVSGVIYI